jgi:hypothetical protein
MRTANPTNSEREARLDRDEARRLDIPTVYRRTASRQLTGRGTLQALLLERTEPDVNAAGILKAWRPSDAG